MTFILSDLQRRLKRKLQGLGFLFMPNVSPTLLPGNEKWDIVMMFGPVITRGFVAVRIIENEIVIAYSIPELDGDEDFKLKKEFIELRDYDPSKSSTQIAAWAVQARDALRKWEP